MNRVSRAAWLLCGCALLCLTAAGCGPKKVTVQGKLTNGADPITGSRDGPTSMSFVPLGEGGNAGPGIEAPVDQETATYKVVIPVGKYRVAVRHYLPGFKEQFSNRFSEAASPIIREVTGDQQLDIDVQKPTN